LLPIPKAFSDRLKSAIEAAFAHPLGDPRWLASGYHTE